MKIGIIGGSLSALSAAFLLHKKHDVTIFDNEAYKATKIIALSFMSLEILKELKHEILQNSVQINDLYLHKGKSQALIGRYELKVDCIGAIISEQILTDILKRNINVNNIVADIESVEFKENNVLLHSQQTTFSEDLSILATGSNCNITKNIGIKKNITNYEQQAIIGLVSFSAKHLINTACEFIKQESILALLPTANCGEFAFVLIVHKNFNCTNLKETFFQVAGFALGDILHLEQKAHFSLFKSIATEQIRERCVIFGNNAHFLHPFAAFGFNLILKDAEVLANCLNKEYLFEDLQNYVDIAIKHQVSAIKMLDILLNLLKFDKLSLLISLFDDLPLAKRLFFNKLIKM